MSLPRAAIPEPLVAENNVGENHLCAAAISFFIYEHDLGAPFVPSPKHPTFFLTIHSVELDLISHLQGGAPFEVGNRLVFRVELYAAITLTHLNFSVLLVDR